MKLVEKYVASKWGKPELCEDAILVTSRFAGVVDGATTSRRGDFAPSPGRIAALATVSAIEELDPNCDAKSAVEIICERIRADFERIDPCAKQAAEHAPSASMAVYSDTRREIWLIGDAQVLLDDSHWREPLEFDSIVARARALRLMLELQEGRSVDELRADDCGRRFIEPLLARQHQFRNSDDAQLGFSALDASGRASERVRIIQVNPTNESLVLATDGYPILASTLAESESELQTALQRDPLCIGANLGTKCMQSGMISYDDRAYVRLDIRLS